MSSAPPLPSVITSDDENTDWAMWEDSVNQVDSQLQSLSTLERRQLHSTNSSRFDELAPAKGDPSDAFSRVGKNRET